MRQLRALLLGLIPVQVRSLSDSLLSAGPQLLDGRKLSQQIMASRLVQLPRRLREQLLSVLHRRLLMLVLPRRLLPVLLGARLRSMGRARRPSALPRTLELRLLDRLDYLRLPVLLLRRPLVHRQLCLRTRSGKWLLHLQDLTHLVRLLLRKHRVPAGSILVLENSRLNDVSSGQGVRNERIKMPLLEPSPTAERVVHS